MITKILKVKTVGSRENGDLHPEICDYLPRGVGAVVLEYATNYAIVKLAWSNHPLVNKPENSEIRVLLEHTSIIEELATHPIAEQLKTRLSIAASKVEEKPGKKIVKDGVTAPFVRKQKGKAGDEYVLDEG